MINETAGADFASLERLFLTLGDKTRLRLLRLMASGPVPVGALVDGLHESQPKVSRHLAYMRESGYVSTRREGKWIYYGINEPDDPSARAILQTVLSSLTREEGIPAPVREHSAPRSKRHLGPRPSKASQIPDEEPVEAISHMAEESGYEQEPVSHDGSDPYTDEAWHEYLDDTSSVSEIDVFLL